jgi:hypothetical protein
MENRLDVGQKEGAMILVLLVVFFVGFVFGLLTGSLLASAKVADALADLARAFELGRRYASSTEEPRLRLVAGGRQY